MDQDNQQIVGANQLRKLAGYESDGRVANFLRKEGIAFFQGREGCWTTLDLIALAGKRKLGLSVDDKPDDSKGVM